MSRFVEFRRIQIRDYKSIAACDVELSPLTFLVGPNGSGKSNFLDALRFVSDCLSHSVEQAIRDRGGINDCRRRSEGRPRHFGMRVEFSLGQTSGSHFAFEIGDRKGGGFTIKHESCSVVSIRNGKTVRASYEAGAGGVTSLKLAGFEKLQIPISDDRFFLSLLSNFADFRPAELALRTMSFYKLNPEKIRDLQAAEAGDVLARDGANAAAVLATLAKKHPGVKSRIEEYLATVAPGTTHVNPKTLGPRETLEFEETVLGASKSRRFLAASMSHGTLRALGILLALFQSPNGLRRVSLIGVEEPETALHPAAAGALLDALREASDSRQVIVTSHSPDLLDSPDVNAESILAVSASDGCTSIAPLTPSERTVLKRRLKTPGEMLRTNQLTPDLQKVPKLGQLKLF